MSDSTIELRPDAMFVVACPVCMGQLAATGNLRGHDACCPLCASLFHVPFPESAATSAVEPTPQPPPSPRPTPKQQSTSDARGLGEDWGPVIATLAPPPSEPQPSHPLDELPAAAFEPPLAEPPAAEPPLAELAFKEPVRTVQIGGEVVEIRRLSPEERRSRRFRRNLLMIVIGISILMAIAILFGTKSAGR
jgi:hypothetical protein